jgi:hypothetical protein
MATTALLLAAVVVSAPASFVVRNVRVYDGEQVQPTRSVLVVDGVIREVGSTVNDPRRRRSRTAPGGHCCRG